MTGNKNEKIIYFKLNSHHWIRFAEQKSHRGKKIAQFAIQFFSLFPSFVVEIIEMIFLFCFESFEGGRRNELKSEKRFIKAA
jgi:hypothetical protein